MRIEFTKREVVVTGGTGALGSAVIECLLAAGARCYVPCRNREHPEHPVYNGHENVVLVNGVDLTEERSVESFYARLPSLWASIHCAGGFAMGRIAGLSLDDFERQHRINSVTCFLCCREAVKNFRRSRPVSGRIVNVASRPALEPRTGSGMASYTAAKAAVAALTVSLAEELAGEQIWVNAVAPSILDTPANRLAMPEANHSNWVSLVDAAAAIAFLASPQNEAVRGALVPIYGKS